MLIPGEAFPMGNMFKIDFGKSRIGDEKKSSYPLGGGEVSDKLGVMYFD